MKKSKHIFKDFEGHELKIGDEVFFTILGDLMIGKIIDLTIGKIIDSKQYNIGILPETSLPKYATYWRQESEVVKRY